MQPVYGCGIASSTQDRFLNGIRALREIVSSVGEILCYMLYRTLVAVALGCRHTQLMVAEYHGQHTKCIQVILMVETTTLTIAPRYWPWRLVAGSD